VTRLLVADDSETVLLMLQRRLEMEGYDVVTATDGVEALDRLKEAGPEPDLILLDAMMPNMSGLEVLEELRSSGSKIPVLMISAHLDTQEPGQMRKLGATDCIPKPFEWEDLIGRIEELANI
jgi:DNA-binding response OmpR family regulator